MASNNLQVWEILVPACRPDGKAFSIEHHQKWDQWVCNLVGGATIMRAVRGRWNDATGELVAEKMIPVRIACSEEQIDAILTFTGDFYTQEEVLAWMISDRVQTWHRH